MATPDVEAEARRQGLRSLLRRAGAEPAARDPEGIIDSALAFVGKLRAQPDPPLGPQRLDEVTSLAGLVADEDWQAPPSLKPRVLVALSHFADGCDDGSGARPEQAADLTELLAEDLREELDGFREFTRQRAKLQRRRLGNSQHRQDLLVQRRRQIRARIQGQRWRRARPS
jgi:hypothetical protein